jgi:hypothetical protein
VAKPKDSGHGERGTPHHPGRSGTTSKWTCPERWNQLLLFIRLTFDGETAMRKAWNILTFFLRLFSAEPVFGAHSQFVI